MSETWRKALRGYRSGAVVYFVQAGVGGPVKIGAAGDLWRRLCTLQTGNHEELLLLGFEICFRDLNHAVEREQEVHHVFAGSRIRGEWFRPSAELYSRIKYECGESCYYGPPCTAWVPPWQRKAVEGVLT